MARGRRSTKRNIAKALRGQKPTALRRASAAVERSDKRADVMAVLEPGMLVMFSHRMRISAIGCSAYHGYATWEQDYYPPDRTEQYAVYIGTTRVVATSRRGERSQVAHKVCLFAVGAIVAIGDPLDVTFI